MKKISLLFLFNFSVLVLFPISDVRGQSPGSFQLPPSPVFSGNLKEKKIEALTEKNRFTRASVCKETLKKVCSDEDIKNDENNKRLNDEAWKRYRNCKSSFEKENPKPQVDEKYGPSSDTPSMRRYSQRLIERCGSSPSSPPARCTESETNVECLIRELVSESEVTIGSREVVATSTRGEQPGDDSVNFIIQSFSKPIQNGSRSLRIRCDGDITKKQSSQTIVEKISLIYGEGNSLLKKCIESFVENLQIPERSILFERAVAPQSPAQGTPPRKAQDSF